MNAIEFNSVWKKFKKGEKFNSLRDSIPHFFKKIATRDNGLQEREFWAVKDVSFNIEKGSVVGIMGPNGAGKSTILKLLSRIIVPNKGTMKINGRLSALIEVTAGFHPELTGRENVYLNGTILGMKKKEISDKFDEIVEFSGVSEFIDTPVKRYSSGMYSRLGFSVAAHMDPEVLLVDEVLAVGDMAFRAKCAEKMRELLKSGCTIVLVSHQLSLIQSLCKRVILLSQGEVIKDGPTDEVIPYYESIVFKKYDEEFRRKINSAADYKVKVDTESQIAITQVSIFDEEQKNKEDFTPTPVPTDKVGTGSGFRLPPEAGRRNDKEDAAGVNPQSFTIGADLTIKVDYKAKQRIDNPIFTLGITRGDGVLCCASSTKGLGLAKDFIDGQGSISILLGKINLAPGIYLLNIGIWDKDMLHPYVIRKKDVLKLGMQGLSKKTEVVFLPEIIWKMG